MMRTLLTSTALVALLATGAVAQDAAAPASQPAASQNDLLTEGYQIVDTDGLASKLIGFPVYNSAADDAERIGEINDIVIAEDGSVSAVLIGVGGFLGVGEKNVAVEYDQLQWTTAADNTERLVLETTKEALNAAPAVELQDDEPMDTAATPAPADQPAAGQDHAQTAMAPAPADQQPAADQSQQTAQAPAADAADQQADDVQTGAVSQQPVEQPGSTTQTFNPEGQTPVDVATLTADDLKGTNVYGPDNQHIGTIGDFVLAEDGKMIDAVVVDFGGFLGIGTKPVAIAYENLQFYQDANGNRSLVLPVTREQMEQAPQFDKDTYAQERDSQLLVLDGAAG
ncbi:MAG TPA: PRC-barrel domain containing protein [Alphaproteobacteria bacterium]|nr:PRC-barrel domain containing protein [Alphaproteobacteria bacterium]